MGLVAGDGEADDERDDDGEQHQHRREHDERVAAGVVLHEGELDQPCGDHIGEQGPPADEEELVPGETLGPAREDDAHDDEERHWPPPRRSGSRERRPTGRVRGHVDAPDDDEHQGGGARARRPGRTAARTASGRDLRARHGSLRGHPGHDDERRDLHEACDAGGVDEALHQLGDHLAVRAGLSHLEQDGDVRRLEDAERDDSHDAHHNERHHQPGVVRARRLQVAQVERQLEPGGERHRDERRHDEHHLRHELRRELGAGRDREPSQDRADDESNEEVDARPQTATGDVIEVEPPPPVEADRRHEKADEDRDDRQALERHDLDDRPRRR